MHMWHHVTNHLIISTDKDSNSENRIKLRVHDTILSPSFPWLLLSTSHLLPYIRFISHLISPLLSIYYLSILVEVLLCLLTYREDLVLLYLVSEDYS
jgi:hypothetical protein